MALWKCIKLLRIVKITDLIHKIYAYVYVYIISISIYIYMNMYKMQLSRNIWIISFLTNRSQSYFKNWVLHPTSNSEYSTQDYILYDGAPPTHGWRCFHIHGVTPELWLLCLTRWGFKDGGSPLLQSTCFLCNDPQLGPPSRPLWKETISFSRMGLLCLPFSLGWNTALNQCSSSVGILQEQDKGSMKAWQEEEGMDRNRAPSSGNLL